MVHMSAGWRPGQVARRYLILKGYWKEVIPWMAQDYHIEALTCGREAEIDLDGAFMAWVERKIGAPIVRVRISDWRPSKQLRMYIQATGMKDHTHLISLYRQAVEGRGDANIHMDHDVGFKDFAARW